MLTKRTGVYCWLNLLNGKRYVGSASSLLGGLDRRRKVHFVSLTRGMSHNRHLQAAWNKYGGRAFKFMILEYCAPEECIIREQFWIDQFNSADSKFGYNIRAIADSNLGVKWSEESKNRRKEKSNKPEERKQLIEMNRRAMKVLRGVERTDSVRAKIAGSVRAAMERDDVKLRMKIGHARRAADPELGRKISKGMEGKITAEVRQRMAESQRERFSNPEECLRYAKLTVDEVLEIRRLYIPWSKEYGTPALAKRFGMSQYAIMSVVQRKTWKHV